MTRKIYIDGRHWDNILALPCVRGLVKRSDNEIVVKVKVAKVSYIYAAVGDALVEDETGSWSVERKEAMAPRRLKSGNMLCPYYNHYIETSQAISVVICTVDSETRTCDWTPVKGCFKYPKGGQQ